MKKLLISLICAPMALFAAQSTIDDQAYIWQIINEKVYDAALYELTCLEPKTAEEDLHIWLMRLYVAEKLQDKQFKRDCMRNIQKISKKAYGGL